MSLATERYIKSYPALMATAIWKDDGLFKLYHYCLYKASRNVYKWRGCVLQPGDMVMSFRNAAADLGWSVGKLKRKVGTLSEMGFVTMTTTGVGTRIHVFDLMDAELHIPSIPECSYSLQLPSRDSSFVFDADPERVYREHTTVPTMDTERVYREHATVPTVDTERVYHEHTTVPTVNTERVYHGHTAVPTVDTECVYHGHASVSTMDTNLEGNQEDTPRYPVRQVDVSKFDQLWLAYPVDRRTSRNEAQKHYRDALIHGATHEAIMTALEAIKGTVDWKKESGRYIPGIAKWLEKETWRDFMPPVVEESEIWTSR